MVVLHTKRSDFALAIRDQSSQAGIKHCLDDEVALDLKGHKHVEQDSKSDGVYFLNTHASSTHTIFSRHGRDSAQSLRGFLEKHLPPQLITDEYGRVTPIVQVSDNHLPSLQAQMWRDKCDGYAINSPCLADSKSMMIGFGAFAQLKNAIPPLVIRKTSEMKEAVLLASHAEAIADLLDANHIFMLVDKPKTSCEMPTCRMRFDTQSSSSPVVTIEPLIHWGTVTAVTDLRMCRSTIQAFRRTGEMCHDSQWTLAIKHFTPEHPATYCIECLEMLMNKRVEACAMVARTKGPVFTAVNSCRTSMFSPRHRHIDEELAATERERPYKYFAGVFRMAVGEDKRELPSDCPGDEVLMASLRLDGAYDLSSSPYSSSHLSTNSPDNPSRNVTRKPSINVQSCAAIFSSSVEIGQAPPSPSSPSTNRSINYLETHPPLVLERLGYTNEYLDASEASRDELGTINKSASLYQGRKRKFGQELDVNAVARPRKHSSAANTKMKVSKKDASGIADIRNIFYSPTEPLLSVDEQISQVSKVQPATVTTAENSPDRSSNSSVTTLDSAATNYAKDSGIIEACKAKTKSKAKPSSRKTKSPVQKAVQKPTTKPTPKTKDAAPELSFTPFFAKRPSIDPTSIPDTISPQAYLAHHSRAPDPTETICTCHKAALTPTVKLAQCSNTACVIGWYHYDCLDKSGKISSRHGRLVCQHCKVDAHFKDLDAKNGWSVEQMVRSDSRMPYMGQDMVDAIPGLGGGFGVVNPYGLCSVVEVPPMPVVRPSPGALGQMGFFGYVVSRPLMLNEAYGNGAARLYLEMSACSTGGEVEDGDEEGSWDEYDCEDEGFFDGEVEQTEAVEEVEEEVAKDMNVEY